MNEQPGVGFVLNETTKMQRNLRYSRGLKGKFADKLWQKFQIHAYIYEDI